MDSPWPVGYLSPAVVAVFRLILGVTTPSYVLGLGIYFRHNYLRNVLAALLRSVVDG